MGGIVRRSACGDGIRKDRRYRALREHGVARRTFLSDGVRRDIDRLRHGLGPGYRPRILRMCRDGRRGGRGRQTSSHGRPASVPVFPPAQRRPAGRRRIRRFQGPSARIRQRCRTGNVRMTGRLRTEGMCSRHAMGNV